MSLSLCEFSDNDIASLYCIERTKWSNRHVIEPGIVVGVIVVGIVLAQRVNHLHVSTAITVVVEEVVGVGTGDMLHSSINSDLRATNGDTIRLDDVEYSSIIYKLLASL
jgi:hypothetical protein